ncbi:MAG: 8-amino-7-oxononanoate synthase [Ahniella sp.]|nr:8-amino-7-oxononanoate synthase [Ahniella sp.]
MRVDLAERIRQRILEREARQLGRRLRTVEHSDGTHIVIAGRSLLSFASNDYLGLAQAPELSSALTAAIESWGVGATAAHLLGGHRQPHVDLEVEAAEWLGYERALLFSTGYAANLAVLSTLLEPGDLCVQDKLNHACLLDGARLSGALLKRYRHADTAHAASLLQAEPQAAALIASDAVFSMDGDIAPIAELADLAHAQRALLYLDDAHGVGVLGEQGRGSVAAAGLDSRHVPLLMVTLGKAIGSHGALVLGSNDLIDSLMQLARPYVFSTAMPPAVAAASLASIRLLRRESWRQERLQALIQQFQPAVSQLGFRLMPSRTAIQPILVGDEAEALRLSAGLEAAGLYVPAIRHPTVPKGQARLRVTLSAAHSDTDLARLIDALATLSESSVQT